MARGTSRRSRTPGPVPPAAGHRRPAPGDGRRAVRLAAAALRARRAAADDAFDRLLPEELRDVSRHYWTPVPVVRRAAAWLREARVRNVVDVGSGAGKFCIAAALLTRCRFTGVEHRASLVAVARDLAVRFGVDRRVSFVDGDLRAATGLAADAYYLFNPFGEYAFSPRFGDPGLVFSPEARERDIAMVTTWLAQAPAGTFVITYNGFGGAFPASYEQLDVLDRLPGTLRFWRQRGSG